MSEKRVLVRNTGKERAVAYAGETYVFPVGVSTAPEALAVKAEADYFRDGLQVLHELSAQELAEIAASEVPAVRTIVARAQAAREAEEERAAAELAAREAEAQALVAAAREAEEVPAGGAGATSGAKRRKRPADSDKE